MSDIILTTEDWKIQLLNDHNKERQRQGLVEFRWNPNLEQLAKKQIEEIRQKGRVHHGNVPSSGLQNIANGKKNLLKPDVPIRLWLSDSGHKAPIIKKDFRYIGGWFSRDQENNVVIVCNYSS